jgi:hypothetical protein
MRVSAADAGEIQRFRCGVRSLSGGGSDDKRPFIRAGSSNRSNRSRRSAARWSSASKLANAPSECGIFGLRVRQGEWCRDPLERNSSPPSSGRWPSLKTDMKS